MCPRYEPGATDSPHLGGVQPTWGDLPYACELVQPYYQMPDRPAADIKEELDKRGKETKVDQQHRLLELLGILDPNEGLLPSGIWLAEHFEPANQKTFSETTQLDVKSTLSAEEQGIWKTLLFEHDWLPMLATINQLATTRTESTETKSRAEAFRDRVEHLDSYQPVNSINSWRKKVQAHLEWIEHLGYAEENVQGSIVLTDSGSKLHQRLRTQYHPEWPPNS